MTASIYVGLLLQVKAQAKTDKFTMEIMRGRDDRRPVVSIDRILHAACECCRVIKLKKLSFMMFILLYATHCIVFICVKEGSHGNEKS